MTAASGAAEPFFLGVTTDFCRDTPILHAIRELVTNAVDADPSLTLCGATKVDTVSGGQRLVIANKSTQPLRTNHLLQGPSTKKGSDKFFGGFGCGLKDALAVFCREEIQVRIYSAAWCGSVTEAVRPMLNGLARPTAPEVCVMISTPTEADRAMLARHNNADVVVELIDAKKRLSSELDKCQFRSLDEYQALPGKPPANGRWMIRRNAVGGSAPTTKKGAGGKDAMHITLRGLYWIEYPLPKCGDLVFDMTRLKPEERASLGRDRQNLKINVVIQSACDALENLLHVQWQHLPEPLRTRITEAANQPHLHTEIAKSLSWIRTAAPPPKPVPFGGNAGGRGRGGYAAQAPPPPCTMCPQLHERIRELVQMEMALRQQLLEKDRALARLGSTNTVAHYLLPPSTAEGLTSWAQSMRLTPGSKQTIEQAVSLLQQELERKGFTQSFVQGSTFRNVALRGHEVDIDVCVLATNRQLPAKLADLFAPTFDTSDSHVFTAFADGARVICDLIHPSYPQHPIDVAFYVSQQQYDAQREFANGLRRNGDLHVLLVIALKRWARNVVAMQNEDIKVPGYAMEVVANKAFEKTGMTSTNSTQLTPALFAVALRLLESPAATGVDPQLLKNSKGWSIISDAAAKSAPHFEKQTS